MIRKPIFSFLIFMLQSISHILVRYRPWKWAQMTRLVKGFNTKFSIQKRTCTKIIFRESYDELTSVFWPKSRCFSKNLLSLKIRRYYSFGNFQLIYFLTWWCKWAQMVRLVKSYKFELKNWFYTTGAFIICNLYFHRDYFHISITLVNN
jgi:hypothetical protein